MKCGKILSLLSISLVFPVSLTGEPAFRMRLVQLQLEETSQETAVSEDTEEAYEKLPVKREEPPPKVGSAISFRIPPGVRTSPPPWLLDDSLKGDSKSSGIQLPDYLKDGHNLENRDNEDIKEKEKRKDKKELEAEETFRQKLAQTAENFLANKVTSVTINGRAYRIDRDCAHFVRAVYWYASGEKTDIFYEAIATGSVEPGIQSGVRIIDIYLRKQLRYTERKPKLGDIVIFDNTWDKNNNKKKDDDLTHVGIVTGFTEEGTIVFVHGNASKTIKKGFINFNYPTWTIKDSKHYNSYGRVKYNWDNDVTGRLNAALVRGFGGF